MAQDIYADLPDKGEEDIYAGLPDKIETKKEKKPDDWFETALRTGPAVAGSLIGGMAGIPALGVGAVGGGMIGGGVGSAVGNLLGNWYSGEDFNPKEFGVETVLGAAPPILGPAKFAGKGLSAIGKYALKNAGLGALEGGVVAAGGTPFQHWAETGSFNAPLSDYARNFGGGAAFGGVLGGGIGGYQGRKLNNAIPPLPANVAPSLFKQGDLPFNQPNLPIERPKFGMDVPTSFDERFSRGPLGITETGPATKFQEAAPIEGPDVNPDYGLTYNHPKLPLDVPEGQGDFGFDMWGFNSPKMVEPPVTPHVPTSTPTPELPKTVPFKGDPVELDRLKAAGYVSTGQVDANGHPLMTRSPLSPDGRLELPRSELSTAKLQELKDQGFKVESRNAASVLFRRLRDDETGSASIEWAHKLLGNDPNPPRTDEPTVRTDEPPITPHVPIDIDPANDISGIRQQQVLTPPVEPDLNDVETWWPPETQLTPDSESVPSRLPENGVPEPPPDAFDTPPDNAYINGRHQEDNRQTILRANTVERVQDLISEWEDEINYLRRSHDPLDRPYLPHAEEMLALARERATQVADPTDADWGLSASQQADMDVIRNAQTREDLTRSADFWRRRLYNLEDQGGATPAEISHARSMQTMAESELTRRSGEFNESWETENDFGTRRSDISPEEQARALEERRVTEETYRAELAAANEQRRLENEARELRIKTLRESTGVLNPPIQFGKHPRKKLDRQLVAKLAERAEALSGYEGQISRLQNLTPEQRAVQKKKAAQPNPVWDGFAKDQLEGLDPIGEPGLTVTDKSFKSTYYNDKRYLIEYRDNEGRPVAMAKVTENEDGVRKVPTLAADRTHPRGAIGAMQVLQTIAEMNAAEADGIISDYTANMIARMREFINDERGSLDIGGFFEGLRNLKNRVKKDPRPSLSKLADIMLDGPPIDDDLEKMLSGMEVKKPGNARQWYNLSRGTTTTMDISAPLRQGFPLLFTKQFWKAWVPMVKSMGSETAFQKTLQDLRERPIFKENWDPINKKVIPSIAHKSGMKLSDLSTSREEALASSWAESGGFLNKIPSAAKAYKNTIGRATRGSNRAYTAFLNQLRADTFESLMKDGQRMAATAIETGSVRRNIFKEKFTPEQAMNLDPFNNKVLAKEIADFVNTATGRGPLKVSFLGEKTHDFEQNAKLLTDALFSPRLVASRVRMLSPGTYMMATPMVRKQYLKAFLSTGTAWFTIAGLAKMAGAEVSMDTNSADFGKIKIGNTRLDPAGGFQQYFVALSRLLTGHTSSSASGTDFELGKGYKADTRKTVEERFVVNKLHPVVKFGYDIMNASERTPFHVADRTAQLFVPLIVGDMMEMLEEDPSMLPLMLPVAAGMGTQTYDRGESRGKFINPENDLLFEGGSLW
jgi:hypothetical protein